MQEGLRSPSADTDEGVTIGGAPGAWSAEGASADTESLQETLGLCDNTQGFISLLISQERESGNQIFVFCIKWSILIFPVKTLVHAIIFYDVHRR